MLGITHPDFNFFFVKITGDTEYLQATFGKTVQLGYSSRFNMYRLFPIYRYFTADLMDSFDFK